MQIVHVSFSLSCPRVTLAALVRFSPPIPFRCFCKADHTVLCFVLYLDSIRFNKHVEMDFLQHGLGTVCSNTACFDKDLKRKKKKKEKKKTVLDSIN